MREIKFRAWDKKTKSMISEVFEVGFGNRHNPETWLVGDDRQTDSFELMQYTGINDKNGKKIYEEDIVLTGRGKICIVKFERGAFFAGDWFEVLGNTFENPELLEKNAKV
jgi:uncharacterized phage protein (TIGR01671 family)